MGPWPSAADYGRDKIKHARPVTTGRGLRYTSRNQHHDARVRAAGSFAQCSPSTLHTTQKESPIKILQLARRQRPAV